MAFSRYDGIPTFINKKDLYQNLLDRRDVKHIKQYESVKYKYPTQEQINSLSIISHVWKRGDRLYKLAYKHYGDPKLWWVIAWYNKKPSESMYVLGDTVSIPFPVERAIEFVGL
jgi:nucleoid-associated protein YgaU